MTENDVKSVLNGILDWPPERQEDAVRVLKSMEAQDSSHFRLADDQVAEIERRRADDTAHNMTLDEFNETFDPRRRS
jgi:hypothetical protein